MMGDLLSASSLLLAVIGILYGFWYGELHECKNIKIPKRAPDRTKYRIKVIGILWSRALPLATSSVLLAAVFLPDAIRLVTESFLFYLKNGFSFSTYDSIKTAFCVVVGFKIVLAVYLSISLFQILDLWNNLRRKETQDN